MPFELKMVLAYLVLINFSAFLSMELDKKKAIKNQYRIPEKVLFGLALAGGSIGSICGMKLFRHKTKHLSFVVGMPAILILQVIIALVIVVRLY